MLGYGLGMRANFSLMPEPKADSAVERIRARRAALSGTALASYDRACAAWAEHMEAELEAPSSEEEEE